MAHAHITSPKDLQTTSESILEGFLSQAKTKWKKAEPYLQKAYHLRDQLKRSNEINKISGTIPLNILATAVGFSDKAQGHMEKGELHKIVLMVLEEIARMPGKDFREELLFRYLLTSGDSLGGEMRNVTGALGQSLFAQAIIHSLDKRRIVHHLAHRKEKIVQVAWKDRILLFDRKPQFLGNNVDVILLKSSHPEQVGRDHIEKLDAYLACGELKGGIDPAGADEHWKTAATALQRIRAQFKRKGDPKLFFAGAAIEEAMSKEIYKMLTQGELDCAANLTKKRQLQDLADWLTSL